MRVVLVSTLVIAALTGVVMRVHVVFGSHMRPCKPCALDLTIANTRVRF